MKLIYIILQYNLKDKTIECVKNIKSNTEVDFHIIIVDNCSTNNAYNTIRDYYRDDSTISIIKTNKNLGFANGNNYGVKYAMKHYDFDWLVIMNNDIYLKSKITEDSLDSNYKVIGPDIYRLDTNEHQNPLPGISYSSFYIFAMKFIYQFYLILNTLYLDFYFHKLAICGLNFIKKIKSKKQNIKIQGKYVVTKIHGSVIFFNKNFISLFPQPFHPSTFMYLEEDFLALRCKKSQIDILYDSKLVFYHDHSSTVNSILKNNHERSRYVYKNNINSLKAFEKYFNGQES